MNNIRLGHIGFLNVLPLTYSLKCDQIASNITLDDDVPSKVNRHLLDKELDVSEVSSIVYAKHQDDFLILPGLAVRTFAKVTSILLVSKKPITEITTDNIALTKKSETSHALLKIILAKGYNARPNYTIENLSVHNPVPDEFAGSLFIGDDALYIYNHKDEAKYYYYDLGAEWRRLTNTGMVYAIWIARKDWAATHKPELRKLQQELVAGFKNGMAKKPEIIRYAQESKDIATQELDTYLDIIKWDLDTEHIAGLAKFYELAHELGLIERPVNLHFADI